MVESQSNLFHSPTPKKRTSIPCKKKLMHSFCSFQNPFSSHFVMLHKPKPGCSATIISGKMGSVAPLAVGTRGTVGSLVRREIEYFKKLDLESGPDGSKRHQEVRDSRDFSTKPAQRSSNTSLGNLLMMSWRKKKRRNNNNGGSYLPSMCSAVEVSEGKRFNGIPGFSYRSIRADMENL